MASLPAPHDAHRRDHAHEPDDRARHDATIASLSHALDAAPLDVDLHRRLCDALRDAGDDTGVAAHRLGLAALDMLGRAPPDRLALALYNVATVYAMRSRHAEAERWYRHALALDPALATAHQNLAAVLDASGRPADAARHRERAYALQRVFVEPAVDAARLRLLIVGVGRGTGNVPIDALLPHRTTCRIKYAIDYADAADDAALPPYDLVFNAIGDPDVAAPLVARISRFARGCGRPVLNPPEAVARTQRHRIASLLAGVPDLIVPRCIRVDARPASADALARQLGRSGVGLPLLLRPSGAHGGDGLSLHTSPGTLWPALAAHDAPCYLTAYHDFRSADGYFRKYRMIYVDRVPYPYHLAISPRWIVHYATADMRGAGWKLDEERRFLADPRATLGDRAMDAIAGIGRRLDLDYGGVDFTLAPDGRVLVFEANATMLAHREAPHGPLAHKNPFVERIADALERLHLARAGIAPAAADRRQDGAA